MDTLTPIPLAKAMELVAKAATTRPIHPHRVFGEAGLSTTGDRSGLWFDRQYSPEVGTWYEPGSPEVAPLRPHLPLTLDRGVYGVPVEGGRTLRVELARFRNAPPGRAYVVPALELT